jgi:hypothetical protein
VVSFFFLLFEKKNIWASGSGSLPLVATVPTNSNVFLFLLSQLQSQKKKCAGGSGVFLMRHLQWRDAILSIKIWFFRLLLLIIGFIRLLD